MQRPKNTVRRHVLAALLLGAATVAGTTHASALEPVAVAGISVGEITSAGLDAADVRAAAEGELRTLDIAQLKGKGNLVIALSLVKVTVDNAVKYTVNAMIRDAKTGNMIAIIEGGAHAQGDLSVALAKQVANAAVRSAISRIPTALLWRK